MNSPKIAEVFIKNKMYNHDTIKTGEKALVILYNGESEVRFRKFQGKG